jgi:hypothetical protein
MQLTRLRLTAICAGALCMAVAVGCGGGAGGSSDGSGSRLGPRPGSGSGSAGRGQGAPASYSWLVATDGAPASIASENRAAGTTAWRLPGPAELIGGAARGAIAGYVSEQAVLRGGAESVYVSAPGSRTVTVRVYRMGWYGGRGGRLILRSAPLPTRSQPPAPTARRPA